MSHAHPDPNAPIVCRITAWYYRRMGLLAAMFLGAGLFFFYDGRIGYPKENEVYEKKKWYENEVVGGADKKDRTIESYEEAIKQGDDYRKAWVQMAFEKGWMVNPDLTEPRWVDYAAAHNWAEEPKYHSPDAIQQQFYFGAAMIIGAAIAGFLVLINHGKVLVGHPDHMVMPNGVTVRFADATCVDKRKWENKGLAYVHYREAEGAPSHRVTVDDLKYGGAGRVLDRLLEGFKGELIEKAAEDEESKDATSTAAPGSELPPKA